MDPAVPSFVGERHGLMSRLRGGGALLTLLSLASVGSSAPRQGRAAEEVTPLAAGAVVERAVKAKETHRYSVELREGDDLQSVVEQHGADVAQTVIGPDGRTVLEMDSFSAASGPDPLAFVAPSTGSYTLVVQANDDEPGSRYVLRIEAVREPTEIDLLRVDAVRATAELSRLSGKPGEGRAALAHGRRAAQAWRQLGERRMEMYCEEGVGFVHRAVLGELEEARPPLERGLALAREVGDRACEARLLFNLGETTSRLGRFAEARAHYEQALGVHRASGRPDKEAFVLMALGRSWITAGDPQQGLDRLHEALQLYEPIGDIGGFFDPRALPRLYMGDAFLELGEYEQALTHYEAALPAFSAHKSLAAQTLTGIGSARAGMGDLAAARAAYADAVRTWREFGVAGREATTALLIGDVHRKEGDLRAALEIFDSAAGVFRSRGDPIGEAKAHCRRGEVHRRLGARDAARSAFEAALAVAPPGNGLLQACAELGLARVALAGADLAAAHAHALLALEAAESLRASVASPATRSATLEAHQSLYDTLIEVRSRQHDREPSAGHAGAALEASERARARTLLELLAEGRVEVREGVDPELSAQERLLRDRLNAVAREHEETLAQGRERAEALGRAVAELTAQLGEAQARIRRASPHYADLALPRPLAAPEIQRQVLDGDTLLLEYALGDDRSHLWIVSAERIAYVPLAPRATIEEAARRLYETMAAPPGPTGPHGGPGDADGAVAELSGLVLPPAATLALDRPRVLVVAPGALQYVPFAMLQAGGAPLLARFEVVTAPSASVVATLRRSQESRPRAARTVAVFADPVFDARDPRVARGGTGVATAAASGPPAAARASERIERVLRAAGRGRLARLPFSRREAEAIAQLAPAGTTLQATGFAANRAAALRPEVGQHRVVHFATHGLLNTRHPDLSGVVLSLVDEEGRSQDGFLRLHDIYNLRLNADLVVLSGCQTALGRDVRGEGLVGLARGFMYAGARAVVASLWQVDDESTAELMRRFYHAMLKEDRRPADALRAAQLEMSRHRRWAAPFHWAGFVLEGDWR